MYIWVVVNIVVVWGISKAGNIGPSAGFSDTTSGPIDVSTRPTWDDRKKKQRRCIETYMHSCNISQVRALRFGV